MEKRINGFVIERIDNNDTLSFKIKIAKETTCNVINCRRVPTDPDAMKKGIECYSGNVVLNADSAIKEVSAQLWVYPNGNCVIVYND